MYVGERFVRVAAQTADAGRRSIPRSSTPSSGAASAPIAAAARLPSSGVKGRTKEAYFGAVGGGLWKTTDGGAKWAPVTDGQITSSSVGAVAVSESNPDVVYIGMGESCIRGNIMAGRRRLQVDRRRQDLDARRLHATPTRSRRSASIPTNPDIVFVADFGRYGKDSDERGVFKTHRRRQELEEGAVPQRQDRRGRRRDRSQESERDVRRAVGGVSRRVPDVERRPRQRPLQVDRRRRHLEGDHAQPGPAAGPRSARSAIAHLRRRLEPRLRAGRERERRPLQSPTMPARRGSWSTTAATSASARSTTRTSSPIPNNKDVVYMLNTSAFRSIDGGKTLTNIGKRHARRSPRPLDRSGRSEARRARQRRRRRGDLQRRRGRSGPGRRRISRPSSSIT